MPQPYKLFTIYAREDAQYLEELRGQLRPLEHAGRIKVWSDREINPGVDWEREIVQNLDSADIILILVSAAYYNSAYIHEKEIIHAINRHERGEAKVLPVIVRPCSFLDDPVISRLQVLPTDGKPVNSHHWRERDDAWLDVVAGVKRTIEVMQQAEWQREADAKKGKEEEKRAREEAKERAENEHLVQIRRKQEQKARDADLKAWQQAADAHHIPAYENYIASYPQGEYAREARFRIKELKRKNANPLSWERYAIISGGVLAVVLLAWLVSNMFGGGKEQQGAQTISPSSLPENVGVQTAKKSGLEMVQVAGGVLTMGCLDGRDTDCGNDEKPVHTVNLSDFQIGKYEVTQADWRDVMGSNPSYFKNCDDCPVEQVSWNDIQDFLKELNTKYSGKGYRLPTEAEWEFAARGGTVSRKFQYAGGNDMNQVGWYGNNSDNKTHPVGQKSPNELGLYDMSGNVWEWCSDWYASYPTGTQTNPTGPASGSPRVIRGGGWINEPQHCRSAYRNRSTPPYRFYGLGFRLAASPF